MSDLQGGFRSQQRFVDPAATKEVVPAEWTAPTPPEGFPPVVAALPSAAAVPESTLREPGAPDLAPYLDLSTVALLGKANRAPSGGWRKALYWASAKLINLGESPKAIRHDTLVAQVQRPLRKKSPMKLR